MKRRAVSQRPPPPLMGSNDYCRSGLIGVSCGHIGLFVMTQPYIREPAVAGLFYPSDSGELRRSIDRVLSENHCEGMAAKAMILPHAGYPYSGPVAAKGYSLLEPIASQIKRVVLLGPAHRVAFSGIAFSSAEAFATPLGVVEVDRESIDSILEMDAVLILDEAHEKEHCLEVHIPFLQTLLGSFKIVPGVVGEVSSDRVASILESLWGGPETLIIISSDLSHFHDYDSARIMDAETSRCISGNCPEGIRSESACGRLPILGLLQLAETKKMTIQTLDLRNSGDTAGPRDRVVGYGAFAFH